MLTDLQIKKLAPAEHRREVPDGKIGGLYLVVQPSGAKSWALRYRVAGAPKKFTIGPHPAIDLATARKRAQEALGEVAGGKDPAAIKRASRAAARAERATEDDRVERVADLFLTLYVKRSGKVGEGWGNEICRLFKIEILPRLGAKRVGDVRKGDINDILDAIVTRGSPITANRTLAVLRKFFNWARDDRGLITVSPCQGVTAPAEESPRDRVLNDNEIPLAWAAFERIGWPFGPIAKLLLLTGTRRDEIASARWSEIDLDANTLTIAKERSKNGIAHEIPLSMAALRIIKELPRIGDKKGGYVFTTTGETPVSGFSRLKSIVDGHILDALKKEAEARGDDPEDVEAPPHWTLHDLRRTVATSLQKLGVRLEVTEAVLNHVSGSRAGIVAVYQRHEYASEKRSALDAWARRLDAIVTDAPATNVLELVTART
jgi:integrase